MEFENISLHTLCQNAAGILENQIAEKRIHLTVEYPKTSPMSKQIPIRSLGANQPDHECLTLH